MSQPPPPPPLVPPSSSPPPPPPPPPPPHLQNQFGIGTGYAVELYLDAALENQVLKAWNVLARRQISTHLIDVSSRPHLTLLSLPPSLLLHDLLPPLLRSLASRLHPLPLSLSSIASFPSGSIDSVGGGGGVLFLAPTPSMALLNLHAQLCEAMRKELGVEIPEEFRPDTWVPQCAVALDVPKSRMAEAFCISRDLRLPVQGYAVEIGLVEFSPSVREVCSFPLGGASGGSDA